MEFQTNNTIDTGSNTISLIILVIFFIILLIIYVPFFKNRRYKLYLLDLSHKPIRLLKLGWIMHEVKPDTRRLSVKKKAIAKPLVFNITESIWKLKSDFRSFVDTKAQFLIVGNYEHIRDHEYKLNCSLTKKQMDKIVKSESILSQLNQFVEDKTDSELQGFKNVAQSSLMALQEIHKVKDEFVGATKYYGQGIVDGASIVKEIFGLDDNEINYEKVEKILDEKAIRQAKKQIAEKEQNEKPKKRGFLRRKQGD